MPLTNEEINNNPNMSEKEKKFARWFASEKILICDMDDGNLRAHIEELQDIASEARARLTASNDEAMERGAKKKRDRGFSTSVASDDFTSETINNIAERQKKMSKVEKEIERLVSIGIDRKDAENMYRASTINQVQKVGTSAVLGKTGEVKDIVNSIVNPTEVGEKKTFVNPFAPKQEPISQDIQTQAQVTAILVEKKIEEEIKQEEKPKFVNPFAKKD